MVEKWTTQYLKLGVLSNAPWPWFVKVGSSELSIAFREIVVLLNWWKRNRLRIIIMQKQFIFDFFAIFVMIVGVLLTLSSTTKVNEISDPTKSNN